MNLHSFHFNTTNANPKLIMKNKFIMKQKFLNPLLSLAILAMFNGSASAATILASDPLNVAGLSAGQSFQIVFVTSTRVQADLIDGLDDSNDASTISQWNAHINTVADGSSISGFGALTWSAIISTGTSNGLTNVVNARDNALVSQAVYNTGGSLIATGFADMWDGSIALNIDFNENGVEQNTTGGSSSGKQVWSGSLSTGFFDQNEAMGDNGTNTAQFRMGDADVTTTGWISQGNSVRRDENQLARVYGLSEVITIAPVPEPSVALLGGFGFLALLRRRR